MSHTGDAEAIRRALEWIHANLERMNPLTNPDELLRSKMVLELSGLAYYLSLVLPDMDSQFTGDMLRFIFTICSERVYRDRLTRHPNLFRLYALPYIVLERTGYPVHGMRNQIQKLLDAQYCLIGEEQPFRYLEMRYLIDLGGFSATLPPYQALYDRTLLAQSDHICHFTDNDIYCITHTLFYLSDFGRRDIAGILKNRERRVIELLTTILGVYCRRSDFDLVAEVLISLYCLNQRFRGLPKTALDLLISHQRSDGSVPGPKFEQDTMLQLNQAEGEEYYFVHNYHTTIVAALALCFAYDAVRRHG